MYFIFSKIGFKKNLCLANDEYVNNFLISIKRTVGSGWKQIYVCSLSFQRKAWEFDDMVSCTCLIINNSFFFFFSICLVIKFYFFFQKLKSSTHAASSSNIQLQRKIIVSLTLDFSSQFNWKHNHYFNFPDVS